MARQVSNLTFADGINISTDDVVFTLEQSSNTYSGVDAVLATKQNFHIIIDTDNNDTTTGGFTIRQGAQTVDASTEIFRVKPDGAVSLKNYSLPLSDGSNGQVLVTNGSGNLVWSTPTTGSGSGTTTTFYKTILANANAATSSSTFSDHTVGVANVAVTQGDVLEVDVILGRVQQVSSGSTVTSFRIVAENSNNEIVSIGPKVDYGNMTGWDYKTVNLKTVFDDLASNTYTIKLQWKTNYGTVIHGWAEADSDGTSSAQMYVKKIS